MRTRKGLELVFNCNPCSAVVAAVKGMCSIKDWIILQQSQESYQKERGKKDLQVVAVAGVVVPVLLLSECAIPLKQLL